MELTAIILLGHGSRVPEAGKNMVRVAEGLKRKHGYFMVEVCYMSRLGPHFPETFEKCVKNGATSVIVIPYFLHDGLHLVLDIPEMMQEKANLHPHVKVILGNNLGYDDMLIDLVQRRIDDSMSLEDVKDLVLPPKEKFPIPPGQFEFVPMKPEEAQEYFRKRHH